MTTTKSRLKSRLHAQTNCVQLERRRIFFYQAQRYSFYGDYANLAEKIIKVKTHKTTNGVKANTLKSIITELMQQPNARLDFLQPVRRY